MGSSDLNLKKSWHPSTFKNQERVWKEEQKRKEEERKLEQLKKELAEERQLQELQQMQEESGAKQKSNKLDWMYAGPNASMNGSNDNSMEDFLLGKKSVDELLRAKQRQEVQTATEIQESRFTLSNSNANTERDIQSKIREDPLLMIKKREQMALKAIVENPLKLKELKKKEKKDKKKKKDSKSEKHHHHSSSSSKHRDYDRDERRHREYDRDERRHRHSDGDRRRHERDDSRDHKERYSSSSSRRRRSASPYRR